MRAAAVIWITFLANKAGAGASVSLDAALPDSPSSPRAGASPDPDDPEAGADDRSLVRRAQAGDMRAFQTLVERYQGKAYSVAFGILRNPDDARDVVQDALIKVHKHLPSFRGESGFYTWLYRIVYNRALDVLRKPSRQEAYNEYDDTRAVGEDSSQAGDRLMGEMTHGDPAEVLRRKELGGQIWKAMDQLSEEHRAVVVLREVEGLSYAEIATALKIPKGTVMSRLFYARKLLQEQLAGLLKAEVPSHG